MTFIITTSARDGTVRLSKSGVWGNEPYDTIEAAESAARALGATQIIHERGR